VRPLAPIARTRRRCRAPRGGGVRERAGAAGCFQGANEGLRTFQCYHFTGRPYDLSEINGSVAGTGSDVEHAFTNCDAGSLPTIQSNRSPDAMLQAESG